MEREIDQADCPRSEDLAEYGSPDPSFGGDVVFLRARDSAAPETRSLEGRDRSNADEERGGVGARASDVDPVVRGTAGARLRGRLRRRATLRQTWSREHASQTASAYVPLSFAPGEAYQFDWSHEIVVMNGVTTTVKAAHVRLCHSRMMFVRTYPRETQEMVFDAHERGFAFFKGACTRGIYDNPGNCFAIASGRLRWRRSSPARTGSTIAASCKCARTTSSIPS